MPKRELCLRTPPRPTFWTTRAPMLKEGACGASGVIGGKLYVYSACPKLGASFQRYDPATNSWKTLAVPASTHSFPTAGVIGGKFYLVGGFDTAVSSVVEAYDPATITWREGPSMPTARYSRA